VGDPSIGNNLLKSRDDRDIVRLDIKSEEEISVIGDYRPNWIKQPEQISVQVIRKRLEPWLTALFQSENLSMLIGSGLTTAVTSLAGTGAGGMAPGEFSVFTDQIKKAVKESSNRLNRDHPNFEDQIRVANELFLGLSHYLLHEDESKPFKEIELQTKILRDEISENLAQFASQILEAECNFIKSSRRTEGFNYLVNFLMSPASRTGTRERLHIFTTNYDRFIEAGAEIAGLHLLDRFIGSISPVFRSSRLNLDMHYNPPGIRGEPRYLEGVVRFSKLHGSVDWINVNRNIRRINLPFGATNIKDFLHAPGNENATPLDLMIYPNSSKDRETAAYPYVDLFRDFAAAICRPNTTLVTYGFGFGDEHINRVIEDMLTIPSTHLVIISFSDPMNRIMKMYENTARTSQITLMIGNHLGNLRTIVDHYLPKPAIDKATYRMSELLRSRFGNADIETQNKDEGY
jgi:hypothetical protein